MRLRPLDAADRRAYLEEIRPRFLVLHLNVGRTRLRWWVPTWALEEPLRLALGVAPLLARWSPALARHLPAWARPVLAAAGARPAPQRPAPEPPAGRTAQVAMTRPERGPHGWHDLDALFSEAHRDLLRLPAGAPLVDITTRDTRIRITERRLGPEPGARA